MPYKLSFHNKRLCGTTSKALEKSNIAISTGTCLSRWKRRSWIVRYSVLGLGIKSVFTVSNRIYGLSLLMLLKVFRCSAVRNEKNNGAGAQRPIVKFFFREYSRTLKRIFVIFREWKYFRKWLCALRAGAPARSCVQAQTARYHSKWSYIVNYSTVT